MRLRRNCEEVLKAVPCTVRSGNAVEDDETKVMFGGAAIVFRDLVVFLETQL